MHCQTITKFPLNYTGGKTKLLPQLLPLFPDSINCFVDLFCGGGNVAINMEAKKYIYNDKDEDLIKILNCFREAPYEAVERKIEANIAKYGLSDSRTNGYHHYGCDSAKGLGAYNKQGYHALRDYYNRTKSLGDDTATDLITLIIFAFNNQIRFNSAGNFNLPVGKRDFNKNVRANMRGFIEKIQKQDSELCCMDFRSFDIDDLSKSDFVYCDPPYLITTATYNEKSGWTEEDERDLLSFLTKLDKRGIKFALSNVLEHKGRENNILKEWSQNYIVNHLDFCYNNSNYHSKNTATPTKEVLITNY